jgi:hypothetical protein
MDLDSCLTKLINKYLHIHPLRKLDIGFLDYSYTDFISGSGIIGGHRDLIAVGVKIDKNRYRRRGKPFDFDSSYGLAIEVCNRGCYTKYIKRLMSE